MAGKLFAEKPTRARRLRPPRKSIGRHGPAWLLQFPQVQPPTDLFFEATGVLTLAFGLLNAWYLRRLVAIRQPDHDFRTLPAC